MIGFYDYTIILTYSSLLSAVTGIILSLHGNGHPYVGVMFLLISGLCDTFDGKVARSKKNRTDKEKAFGVQIDSLSDLVAFGVLPVCIGIALYKRDVWEHFRYGVEPSVLHHVPLFVLVVIGALFVLCALIRLAYFNITVEETQGEAVGDKKYYFGLPVTSTALIFPTFLLIRYCFDFNLSFVYFILMIIVGLLFVVKFKLPKPKNLWVYLMVAVGAVEFILTIVMKIMARYHG